MSLETKQAKNYNINDNYQNETETMIQFVDTNMLNSNNILTSKENNINSALHEPRLRTTSEKFHCHNGNIDKSDDNISGEAVSDHRSNTKSNQKAISVLWISVFICLIFMICEVIGGIWAQSLAIITDAAHLVVINLNKLKIKDNFCFIEQKYIVNIFFKKY